MGLSNYDPGQELSSINFAGMIGGPLTAVVDAQSQSALSTVSFIKSVGFTPDTEDETTGAVTPGSPIYVSFKYPKMLAPFVPGITGRVKNDSTLSVNAPGTNYVKGDVLQLGSGGATVNVTNVDATGGVTAVTLQSPGSGYETGVETAGGGSGTGAKIHIDVEDVAPVAAVFEQMTLEVPILTMTPIPFIRVDNAEIEFNAKITSMEYRDAATELKTSMGLAVSSQNTSTVGLRAGKFLSVGNKNTTSIRLNVNASAQSSTKEGFKIEKTFQLGVKVKASQDEMPAGMDKILGILEDAIVAQPAAVSA